MDLYVPVVPSYRHSKKYLKMIDKSKQYTNFGPLNTLLVERLSRYLKIDSMFITTAANATLAIQGAIETSRAASNSDVWNLPSWTFTATASAVKRSGVQGQFQDVDDDWRIICSMSDENLIDVLPFGLDTDYSRYGVNLKNVIIDAAASFDSLRNFHFPENLKVAIVVSLHATKLLPGGEGAVLISNDIEWISKFKSWTNFGFCNSRISEFPGTNAKLDEYSCAIALSALDSWDKTRDSFLSINSRAREICFENDLDFHSAMKKNFISPYWIVKSNGHRIKRIMEIFSKNGIPFRKWWETGCAQMPAYSNFKSHNLKNTERISRETIGLPFHLYLEDRDWKDLQFRLKESI